MSNTMKRLLRFVKAFRRDEKLSLEDRASVFEDLAEQERTIRALEVRAGCVEPVGEVRAEPFGHRSQRVPS